MYLNGLSVQKNDEKAFQLFRNSAYQGHVYAKDLLAFEHTVHELKIKEFKATYSQPPTDGVGTWEYPGYRYKGSFKNGSFHGWGEMVWTGDDVGHKYVGNFEHGSRHGQGTYTFPSGETQVGLFENNEFVSSKPSGLWASFKQSFK